MGCNGIKLDKMSNYKKFIEKDTQERGEIITSPIHGVGGLYCVIVRKEGKRRGYRVWYKVGDTDVHSKYRFLKDFTNN